MSILILAIVVLVVAALLIWACDLLPLPAPLGTLVKVAIILIAALVILQKSGLIA